MQDPLPAHSRTAAEALAWGAIGAGVRFVSGYPGSPSTEVLEALALLAPSGIHVEWAINEKSAFDAAFASSLAGVRSLLCLKSVGLNVALDSLMAANLAPGDGGFVILVGDDPGGWGSQNEQDSRPLVAAAEIPLLEPTSAATAERVMRQAFRWSERFRLPVAVRIVRALADDSVAVAPRLPPQPAPAASFLPREPDRFNVLPVHVVPYHSRLQAALARLRAEMERSRLNGIHGQGHFGIIAAGYANHKLQAVLKTCQGSPLSILSLCTLHPLPRRPILSLLAGIKAALVVEELAPYVETEVRSLAQQAALPTCILGRHTGHLPSAGELFSSHIVRAIAGLVPGWPLAALDAGSRQMPSRQPLCGDCPYRPAFDSLLALMERQGGRSAFVVTGETGCMVRAQLPPYRLLDVKYAMGSSVGLARGLALAGLPEKVIALAGDSALLHSGLGELIDAAQTGADLLVVVLANRTTALSGCQPHPASPSGLRGQPHTPVDLHRLILACGVHGVATVDPSDSSVFGSALELALLEPGVSVVIADRPCPRAH